MVDLVQLVQITTLDNFGAVKTFRISKINKRIFFNNRNSPPA